MDLFLVYEAIVFVASDVHKMMTNMIRIMFNKGNLVNKLVIDNFFLNTIQTSN